MKNYRVTVKDVAKAAGVSLMTVSRAINGQDGISEETRARILELAHQMNYHPSQIARSLATRQSNTLGLIVPDVANPFFAHIARGAEDAAYENELSVFLINSAESLEREKSALDSLWQNEVTGVILCSSRLPKEDLQNFYDRFSQVVLVNRELESPHSNVSTINVDDEMGAELVVKYFIKTGRKSLALLAGPEISESCQRRKDGFLKNVLAAGLPFDESRMLHCVPTIQGGMDAALQLLKQYPDIDAISTYNDLVAIGAMQACRQTGKKIPGEIAIIGEDDVPLASMMMPALSTLRVDQYKIGRMAVSFFLNNATEQSGFSANRIIQPELIIRESS